MSKVGTLLCGCVLTFSDSNLALIWKHRCNFHKQQHSNIDYLVNCVNQLLVFLTDTSFLFLKQLEEKASSQ